MVQLSKTLGGNPASGVLVFNPGRRAVRSGSRRWSVSPATLMVIAGVLAGALLLTSLAFITGPRVLAETYVNQGLVYSAQGDHDRALAELNAAIQLQPESAEAYYSRGQVYAAWGEKDKASADYNQALELSDDPSLRNEVEQRLRELTL